MRIAIITQGMVVGGIEKALINLLKSEKFKNCDIDLYMMDVYGEWMHLIPETINVIKMEFQELKIQTNHPINLIKSIWYHLGLRRKLYSKQCYYAAKIYEKGKVQYDMAIAYHAPCSIPVFYTLFNIRAKKKILYIHGDVKQCKCNTKFMLKTYQKYDEIRCVSQDAFKVFVKVFPSLKNKTNVEYNLMNRDEILRLSKEPCTEITQKNFNILTVGRLTPQKGIDLAIEVMRMLKSDITGVKWYVCGDGEERENLENLIKEYNLENEFILLGNCDNPYKYMKNCDLYVQPSRHEGYCLTLAEALLLEKYSICTEFAGAYEQIEENMNGCIVAFDSEKLYLKIKKYILERV